MLGLQLDAFADDIHELGYSEVGGNQVLLLVDVRDVAVGGLLGDDWDAVGVLEADALGFSLAFV